MTDQHWGWVVALSVLEVWALGFIVVVSQVAV